MKKIALLLLCVPLLVCMLLFVARDDADQKKGKPRFPLGKETTFVTEPLDAEGYIDYAAALNEHWRSGVTPENNANVLVWRALGPRPETTKMTPEYSQWLGEYFKWMGIEPPPERGDYFIPLTRFARERLKLGPDLDSNAIQNELGECSHRLWKAPEHPNIAAWLKANEKPLALVVEASKRTRFFCPYVPKRTGNRPALLIGALLPTVQKCREFTSAFTARALLRAGEGRFDDAWEDLLTCHRLSRLVARGATMIELLVGISLDAVAAKADLAFLERLDSMAEQIDKCLRDLRKLPPMPLVADKLDFGERFIALQAVTLMDQYGPEAMEDPPAEAPSLWSRLLRASVDYEPALRIINRWHNRIATALRIEDRITREKELAQLDADLRELDTKNRESMPGALELLFARNSAKIRGEKIGNVLICLLMPAFNRVRSSADRCEQTQNNLYLAFALAAYRRDHGHYPNELAALTSKYLDKIPTDLFSGKPLIYRPNEVGYLLYSVGVNGQDDQGRNSDDQPQGDDLSIRIPLPKDNP